MKDQSKLFKTKKVTECITCQKKISEDDEYCKYCGEQQ